jgi:hypothetical protein
MKTYPASSSRFLPGKNAQRGSALLTALIFAIIIVIAVVSSISLSKQSLKLAHRTFFADAANNLAETGLEEAVWSFNTMGLSTDTTTVAAAWSGWTLGNTVADTYMSGSGDGYTSAPTVTFSGGGGTGATGTATLVTTYTTNTTTGAQVTHVGVGGIVVTNPGSGYTSAPTITLTGGGPSIAATAVARLAATRTFYSTSAAAAAGTTASFADLDQKASAIVKVWVAGYDGTAVVPTVVAKASITPFEGPKIEKNIKVILSKNGALPKGVVAKLGINWNGHPFADSYISHSPAGTPPFAPWSNGIARQNTTLASLGGTIDLSQGTVNGNVMTGPGVTVTDDHATITGTQIGNFSYNFVMPTYPSNTGAAGQYALTTLPTILPRAREATGGTVTSAAVPAIGQPAIVTGGTETQAADVPAADGTYYYFVNGTELSNLTITAGKKVVIVGTGNTTVRSGIKIPANNTASPATVGSLKIYMDGNIALSGNDNINVIASPNTSWAGALEIYTTTTSDCTFSGNAAFCGCITAPNAEVRGNGGGNDQSDIIGSIVAKTVRSNGHLNFHFDEALGTTTTAKPWTLALWRELQTPDERAAYATQLSF